MDTIHLYARHGQTADEAWADSEGLYVCAGHIEDARKRADGRLIPVPAGLTAEVLAQGQCEVCWEAWVEGLRIYHEQEESARWERAV